MQTNKDPKRDLGESVAWQACFQLAVSAIRGKFNSENSHFRNAASFSSAFWYINSIWGHKKRYFRYNRRKLKRLNVQLQIFIIRFDIDLEWIPWVQFWPSARWKYQFEAQQLSWWTYSNWQRIKMWFEFGAADEMDRIYCTELKKQRLPGMWRARKSSFTPKSGLTSH